VKGNRSGAGRKIRLLTLFASAFVAGALVIFGLASLLGALVGTSRIPDSWRLVAAATSLLALVVIDVIAVRRVSWCPLGWRRQTPKALVHRFAVPAVLAAWGFDTGLAVTTFRVAALTWGALILTLFGFSSWQSGLAYGGGFVVPMLCVLLLSPKPERFAALLHARPVVQSISAVMLAGSAVLLLTQVTL
jgi:hypothetical protein